MTLIDKAEAHDDDLIRRGDALEICTAFGFSRADECRDRIAALPAVSAPVAVRVKPLEWEEEPDRDPNYPKWTADTGMGKHYFVFKAWWGSQQKWGFAGVDGFYHTKDAAKAAAQADYAARIMAAIDAPDVAELVEALRELHHAVCGETGFAACVRHVIPPKGQGYVEVDRADRAVYHGLPPDHGGDGGHHNGGSSDDNGDVSDE
jgi:hypothetical protein